MLALFLFWGTAGASATTYYIAANGSDSNNGTSKSTPWLHVPGMPACANACRATTPQAGDRFIFRGGDTWHFGNGAVTPYSGGTWTISRGGSSGNLIYYGVDKSWYAGASWARPIMNGDNPTSTSPVAACTYDEHNMAFIDGHQGMVYVQIDNFEFTGMCWSNSQQSSTGLAMYVNWSCGIADCGNVLSNLYIHGWTHVRFSCSPGPTGNCDGASGISGSSQNNTGGGDKITGLVCDGSDSDNTSFGCILWDCYDVENSVLRNASQGAVCNNMHIWHDVLIEDIHESSDGLTHSNGFEFNNEWSATAGAPNYVYNLVVRNNTTAVTGWVCPHYSDVYWNIVEYNNKQQPWDFDTGCGNPKVYFYNSTFADTGAVGTTGNWGGNFNNVLFIGAGTGINGTPSSQTSVIFMTDSQAATAGFSPTSAYAYQPQSGDCNGQTSPTCPIKSGANLTGSWPAGFAINDTSYGCSYDTGSHSVKCPARTPLTRPSTGNWDVGAYQFGATSSGGPQPPTGLTAVVH